MRHRSYQGEADLIRLQDFTAESSAATDGCGYLHPGDVAHHIYNGNKWYDPADLMRIWEDDSGIAAWGLVSPRYKGYDAQVRPDLRGGDLEHEVIEWCDTRTIELIREHGIEATELAGDAFRCDPDRKKVLLELGWQEDDDLPYVVNRARIAEIDQPVIPEGYSIRALTGVEEAGAAAALHVAAFPGAAWTEELYRYVMESPGYDHTRELVAVSPDGELAAFAVTWYDHLNKTGLLEGVGTHPDHQQRGLGKAVVQYASHHMARAGMEYATVANSEANLASHALYRSAGFRPWHVIDPYVKPIV